MKLVRISMYHIMLNKLLQQSYLTIVTISKIIVFIIFL